MKRYKAPKHIYIERTDTNEIKNVTMLDAYQGGTYQGLENTGAFFKDFDDEALACNIKSYISQFEQEEN